MELTDQDGTTWAVTTADLLAFRLRSLPEPPEGQVRTLYARFDTSLDEGEGEVYQPEGDVHSADPSEVGEVPAIEVALDERTVGWRDFEVSPDTVVLVRVATAPRPVPGVFITCPEADRVEFTTQVAAMLSEGFTSGHVDAEHHWTTR